MTFYAIIFAWIIKIIISIPPPVNNLDTYKNKLQGVNALTICILIIATILTVLLVVWNIGYINTANESKDALKLLLTGTFLDAAVLESIKKVDELITRYTLTILFVILLYAITIFLSIKILKRN